MSMRTEIAAEEPTIIMSRVYDAPCELIWEAITEAEHVRQWWGGPGFANPVCEMDVRPGGLWNHVMRFPDGRELHMKFVFTEVEKPTRLVWRHADDGQRKEGPPEAVITVTLQDCRVSQNEERSACMGRDYGLGAVAGAGFGAGVNRLPLSLVPAWMPRLANQPWFISST